MKRKFASLILLLTISVALFAVAEAAVHNPKAVQCVDKEGKIVDSKECDPTSCGCLFHEIEEFISGLFK